MADENALEILRRSVDEFNAKRQADPNWKPDLRFADLSDLNFQNADLSEADLRKAIARNADLSGCNLTGARCENTDFSGSKFVGTTLTGAQMGEANLTRADLTNAKLCRTRLRAAVFEDAIVGEKPQWEGVHLQNVDLAGINLANANLRHADLGETDLSEANLPGADLTGANLHDARLRGTNLESAILDYASLVKADLSLAWIARASFNEAVFDGQSNLDNIEGAPDAKNLEKAIVQREVQYFASCQRNWIDSHAGWEQIRKYGNLRIFTVSYTLLLYLVTSFFLIGTYNEKVEMLNQWGEDVAAIENVQLRDQPVQLLARQSSKVQTFKIGRSSVCLLFSLVLLSIASTMYTFGCPDEVKEFTQIQWRFALNRSLVHYWALSWKKRSLRVTCAVLYLVGGFTFLTITGLKILQALRYVSVYIS